MPSLAEFRTTKPSQIKIMYNELPNGDGINHLTENTNLIAAIHRCFDTQLSDYARHASTIDIIKCVLNHILWIQVFFNAIDNNFCASNNCPGQDNDAGSFSAIK